MEVSQSLQEIFQVFHYSIDCSRLSEIQTASVYSGSDEGRKESEQSLESISDNKN